MIAARTAVNVVTGQDRSKNAPGEEVPIISIRNAFLN